MDTDTKLEVFIAKVTEWMLTTQQYRQDLCAKNDLIRSELAEYKTEIRKDIDELRKFLYELPCKERKGWYQSMGKQVAWMWGVLGGVAAGVSGHLMGLFK